MSNISNLIEGFILDAMGDENSIEISRNSLADYFGCAPSQINYVLETRFTLDRGFKKESKRGGGGFIKIDRLVEGEDAAARLIIESVGVELTNKRMLQILDRLKAEKVITPREVNIIKSALSEEALSLPLLFKDRIRANSFKSILIELMKEKGDK